MSLTQPLHLLGILPREPVGSQVEVRIHQLQRQQHPPPPPICSMPGLCLRTFCTRRPLKPGVVTVLQSQSPPTPCADGKSCTTMMLLEQHADVHCSDCPCCSHRKTMLNSCCCFYHVCHGQYAHILKTTMIGSDCVGCKRLVALAAFCPWGSADDAAKTAALVHVHGQSGLRNLYLFSAVAASLHGDCTKDKQGSRVGYT